MFICMGFMLTVVQSTTFQAYHSAQLQSLFTLPKYGWTGGDGDTSIHLYDDIYLWIFQDSIISCYNQQDEQRCNNGSFVHNAIALQKIANNTHSNFTAPSFIWNTSTSNKPISFFKPSSSYAKQYNFQYWWPDIAISNGSILIVLANEVSTTGNGFGFHFQVTGNSILRIDNIRSNPLLWIYKYHHIDISNVNMSWSSAITWDIDDNNLLYLIGEINNNKGRFNMISKGYFEDLANFNLTGFTYYGTNKNDEVGWYYWSDIDSFNYIIATGGYAAQSEMTVLYNKELQKWYTFLIPFTTSQVYMFLSKNQSIVSDWSYQIIYNITAPWNDSTLYYEYACKAHPELSKNNSNQLVFTWVSNAWNVSDLFVEGGAQIYLPEFIAVDFVNN